MPLPLSQRVIDDSIDSFLKAASQRWKDAEALRRAGRRLAALYLLGYSTEMILKAAYFKAIGFQLSQPITQQDRAQATAGYMALGLQQRPGVHDLTGWSQLLVAKRRTLGIAYEVGFGQHVVNQAQQAQSHWKETIRYQSLSVYRVELEAVRTAARWFRRNLGQLL
jgi:hypothetical protein